MNAHLVRFADNDSFSITFEYRDDGSVYAHSVVHRWSRDIYAWMLSDWMGAIVELRKKGHKEIKALSPVDEENHKTLRFQMMFGFTPVDIVSVEGKEENYYLSTVQL